MTLLNVVQFLMCFYEDLSKLNFFIVNKALHSKRREPGFRREDSKQNEERMTNLN